MLFLQRMQMNALTVIILLSKLRQRENIFSKIQVTMTSRYPFQTRLKLAVLPRLIEECKSLLPSVFISQQDGTPDPCTVKLAHDWIATDCTEFIGEDDWPANSPDVNPLGELCLNVTRHFIPSQRTLID